MWRRLWAALSAVLLAALSLCPPCRAEAPTPPLRWPVTLNLAGALLSVEARVQEPQRYTVSLVFHITLPSRLGSFFDHESAEEASQLHRLLGGASKAEDGSWREAGVPGSFKVRVTDARTGATLADQTVARPGTQATYMGRSARLVELPLTAGTYLIQVEALSVEPELAPLHTFVSFARSHHGK